MIRKEVGNWSKCLGLYSILWLLCVMLLAGIFYASGKSFIWVPDGLYQHFPSFYYLCDYTQGLIFSHQSAGYYNFTLGQGMDVLTTLNSYDLTDPISILCSLLLPLSMECRYTLMIFVKLYLIGFSFLFYCFSIERKEVLPVVLGAIAYTFSGAILFMFARHPNFISWAYFFPFLLAGVELYFRKGKRIPLVLFVFLSILTDYYTFYVNVLLVTLYVVIHAGCNILDNRELETFKRECKKVFGLACVCCIGILLSAFVLLPTIHAYLSSDRVAAVTGYTASAWHYPMEFYKKLFEDIFTVFRSPGYTSFLGLNVVLIFPLILLFMKRNKYAALKLLILLSFLMLCIPFVGRAMNGFSYAINRWSFVIPFYASIAFVILFPEIEKMSGKEKCCVALLALIYVCTCFFHTATNHNPLKYYPLLLLGAVVIVLFCVLHYWRPAYKYITLCLITAGACFQIYFTFANGFGNYVREFVDRAELVANLERWPRSSVIDYDTSFYRVEKEGMRSNTNGYSGTRGTEFWWSIVPSYVMKYHINLALDSITENCRVTDLDSRTGLLALASTKYYTRLARKIGLVPYGYEEVLSANKRYQVFKNQYFLPIGYTYSNYITRDAYKSMSGLEKEQALLQAAVLEDEPNTFDSADIDFNYRKLDYKVVDTQKVTLITNRAKVSAASGSININTQVPEDCEVYVYIKGVKLGNDSSSMYIRANRKKADYSVTKSAKISNLSYQWPVLRDDVAFNLGYGYPGENTITLSFGSKGTIHFDDIQIIAVPMSSYVEHVQKLGKHVLEDVKVGTDEITGTISLPEKRILALSVPYSTGWKAYVDGEETDILRANVMYMAIPLSSGNHKIEMHYSTPYLREGAIVSGITALLWMLYELRRRKIKADTTSVKQRMDATLTGNQ